nr:hypothetical protein [Anaerolineae bacterium]
SMAWGNYDSEYYVSSRVSPVIPIIVSQDTTFTAVLTFIDGQIELTVGDITHTGAVAYEGDFDTLWIGNVGNNTGDIYCSGMIESIVIEKIPDPVVLFEDQFDSTELDRGVWSLDSESSEYCGDASVTMSDGTVQISSGTAHSANCGIRSIPLWTISEGITYLLEARMKDETADGGGAVLCFLEGVPSASRSMISMGYRTNEPTIHTLIEGIGGANDYTEVQLSTDPREWHIYQILIEPHSVTYLIDGEVIESYATTIPRGKTYQLNLIRNSYQVNQTMEVDYIRLTQTSIPPAP